MTEQYTEYDHRIGDSMKRILVNLFDQGFEPSKRQAAMHAIKDRDQKEKVTSYGYEPLRRLINRGLVEVVPHEKANGRGHGAVRNTERGNEVAKQILLEHDNDPRAIELMDRQQPSL